MSTAGRLLPRLRPKTATVVSILAPVSHSSIPPYGCIAPTFLFLPQPLFLAIIRPSSPPPQTSPRRPLLSSLRHLGSSWPPPTGPVRSPQPPRSRASPKYAPLLPGRRRPYLLWPAAMCLRPAAPLLPDPRRHHPWDRLPSPISFLHVN